MLKTFLCFPFGQDDWICYLTFQRNVGNHSSILFAPMSAYPMSHVPCTEAKSLMVHDWLRLPMTRFVMHKWMNMWLRWCVLCKWTDWQTNREQNEWWAQMVTVRRKPTHIWHSFWWLYGERLCGLLPDIGVDLGGLDVQIFLLRSPVNRSPVINKSTIFSSWDPMRLQGAC